MMRSRPTSIGVMVALSGGAGLVLSGVARATTVAASIPEPSVSGLVAGAVVIAVLVARRRR